MSFALTSTGPSVASGAPSHWSLSNSLKETVPPGWAPNRPARVALSLKVSPTVPAAGRWEEDTCELHSRGETGWSPLPETAPCLSWRPAHLATRWSPPTAAGPTQCCTLSLHDALPISGPSVASGAPSHWSLSNSLKETVPPGWAPNRPARVALSLKVSPTVPAAG